VPPVTVLPLGVTVDVPETEPVMASARRQGLWWPTVCGGDAECGSCWAIVEEGWEHCGEMGEAERLRLALGMKANEPRARLACQLRISGPVTVNRRSVRRAAESNSRHQRGDA
jgi:ferredoxin